MSNPQSAVTECSICLTDFDIESEGGVEGYVGLIHFALCPFCHAGMADLYGCERDHCDEPEECKCGN